jgi:hypothetical protein
MDSIFIAFQRETSLPCCVRAAEIHSYWVMASLAYVIAFWILECLADFIMLDM